MSCCNNNQKCCGGITSCVGCNDCCTPSDAMKYLNPIGQGEDKTYSISTIVNANNCDDIKTRQLLLENLNEEEQGKENHPELWMRFAEGMGNTRKNVNETVPMKETEELVKIFKKLSKSEKYHIGLAALYCYESMQPEISETKKDGLQKFYDIKDEDTLKFFTVHMHADKWHRKVVRNVIKRVADSKTKQNEITNSVESALGALNNFLTGMERVYC